jgi:rare lipoprotein A
MKCLFSHLSALILALLFSQAPGLLRAQSESGKASYYSDTWRGRRTSSGLPYNPDSLTAAHKTHPFGTHLLVRNVANGKETIVKVTDRGPFIKGRVVDLSGAAARAIGMIQAGIATVEVQVVAGPEFAAVQATLPERWPSLPIATRSDALCTDPALCIREPFPMPEVTEEEPLTRKRRHRR